jgi:CBS domain-containing protein
MQPTVQSVRPSTPLDELERLFLAARVTGFPVVEDGRLVGVVSRSDILRKLAIEQSYAEYISNYYRDQTGFGEADPTESLHDVAVRAGARLEGLCVADLMSHSPVTVDPGTPLRDLARVLAERGIHRILVTKGDELLGIVTSIDLVRLIADDRVA